MIAAGEENKPKKADDEQDSEHTHDDADGHASDTSMHSDGAAAAAAAAPASAKYQRPKNFKCDQVDCHEAFYRRSDLDAHKFNVHHFGAGFPCGWTCQAAFGYKTHLLRHQQSKGHTAADTGARSPNVHPKLKCPHCNKPISSSHMARHIARCPDAPSDESKTQKK